MHCKTHRYFIVIIISEIKMFEKINNISNIMQKNVKCNTRGDFQKV